jgi:hypothetical protein
MKNESLKIPLFSAIFCRFPTLVKGASTFKLKAKN